MKFKEKKRSPYRFLFIIVTFALIGAAAYLYLSPAFEQNKPNIKAPSSIYWNLKQNINITLTDDSGIKYYKVTFVDDGKSIELAQKVIKDIKKQINISIAPPKLDMFYKGKNSHLVIEAVDNSKWNFLEGNRVVKTIDVKIDTKKPIANVIDNSRYIQRGGSAVVIAKVEDENLKDFYIEFNGKARFKLQPFYKQNYYIALIAWPIDIEQFNRVNLVAIDKANNKTITKVPFYVKNKRIKIDNIKLTNRFIDTISKDVLEQSFHKVPKQSKDIFIYSNTKLRAENIKTIKEVADKNFSYEKIDDFKLKPFKRHRGSKTVANYADRRHYYLNGQKINEAWHLGIDWASVKKSPIIVSNDGKVIFKDYLGLYGNSIIIDHGMGLATLYAHTSTQNVELGDNVKRGQKIANTGSTGAVFGDHLHFGLLIQGYEVNPMEWMDKNWIKVCITNVIKNGKKQIDGK